MARSEAKKPFDFEVLYTLPGGERLQDVLLDADLPFALRVTNLLVDDAETLLFQPLPQVSSAKYHFKLQFNAGVLADAHSTVLDPDWTLLREEDPALGTTNLMLALTGGTPLRLPPEALLSLSLSGVHATALQRAFVSMTLSWPPPDTEAGSLHPLSIVRIGPGQGQEYETETRLMLEKRQWSGRATTPLRLDCVGPHHVLNVEDAVSSLTLRVSNGALPGSQGESVTFSRDLNQPGRSSALELELPISDPARRPWALGTEDQLNNVAVTLAGWAVQGPTANASRTALKWTLTPNTSVELQPDDFLELSLSGLVTHHPSGVALLDVAWLRVPGFRDGRLSCPVQKTPLVFGHGGAQANVGIGTPRPDARLHVSGGPLRLRDAELQHAGPFDFRSDQDGSGDTSSARFFHGKATDSAPLMELSHDGRLSLYTPPAKYGFSQTVTEEGETVTVGSWADKRGGWFGTETEHALQLFTGNGSPQATLETDGTFSLTEGRFKDKTGDVVPVGTLVAFAGRTPPPGWLFCDGRAYSRGDYADLFKALDVLYGHTTDSDFKVPNLMGRVPVGVSLTFPLASSGGEATHTLTEAELPAHKHSVSDPGHQHNISAFNKGGGTMYMFGDEANEKKGEVKSHASKTGISLENTGGGDAHNNMQPYLVVHYIIKH